MHIAFDVNLNKSHAAKHQKVEGWLERNVEYRRGADKKEISPRNSWSCEEGMMRKECRVSKELFAKSKICSPNGSNANLGTMPMMPANNVSFPPATLNTGSSPYQLESIRKCSRKLKKNLCAVRFKALHLRRF